MLNVCVGGGVLNLHKNQVSLVGGTEGTGLHALNREVSFIKEYGGHSWGSSTGSKGQNC